MFSIMHKFFIGLILGGIFGIITGAVVENRNNVAIQNSSEFVVEQDSITVKLEQPEFFLSDTPTVELVLEACKYYKIQYPDIVTAQSILETGYYKSKGCLERHNLFGLYNSYKKDYYTFNHWTESVKAYYDFVQYRYKEGDYYDWLEKIGYAEDPLYLTKVKQVKAKNNL
jgi:hypothetical protein